ncbi:CAP domain-containing protein [Deinococcus sp.]|uniref:CAP domain-containing protein n=1 Tax=Deinococcus sp. TaxID=47478 RepID=UPI0025C14E3A|nr:CAP domain-containing protein [Deinococcus sp.]
MQKKFLPLLLLPVLALASCGGTSTPSNNTAATSPASTNRNVSSVTTTSNTATAQAQSAGDQTKTAEELQILNELNAARAVARDCGGKHMPAVGPVTWNGYLASAARANALDMATRNFFSHVTPDGKTISNRAEAAGYTNWTELGENIAAGYGVGNVTKGWLDSPSHCETMMDPALKEVGIGYVYKPGSTYGTYWVEDFGTR